MALTWTDSLDNIDWTELSALYQAAGMGLKQPDDLATAFANSRYRCFVFEAGQLIGAGRALADGVDCSYLCDIAVRPADQGRGLGRQIVGRLVDCSRQHRKIILYAVPGKEDFYGQFGFRRMSTAMAIFENPADAEARGLLR